MNEKKAIEEKKKAHNNQTSKEQENKKQASIKTDKQKIKQGGRNETYISIRVNI